MTSPKSFLLNPALHDYLLTSSAPLDESQRELIDETRKLGEPAQMQIAPEQGIFLTLLTRLIGARKAVEVGTFTGYSALCIARGLVDGGRLLCCDVSEEWTAIAQRAWRRAGVEDRITLRLGPAIDTLRDMDRDEEFDLAFIDADKESYSDYWNELVPRVRAGGVLLVDNTLWSGRVADPQADDARALTLRDFNAMVAADQRVECLILPLGDGLTMAVRR